MTKERVEYKICILTWKVAHLGEPKMICRLLPTNEKDVRLRSSRDTSKVCMNKKIATTTTSKDLATLQRYVMIYQKSLEISTISTVSKTTENFHISKGIR